MRYRVDLIAGYASYSEEDKDKAFELYHERGIRIVAVHDDWGEGVLIEGIDQSIDIKRAGWNPN